MFLLDPNSRFLNRLCFILYVERRRSPAQYLLLINIHNSLCNKFSQDFSLFLVTKGERCS